MYKAFSSGLLGFGGRKIEDDISLAAANGYEGIIVDIAAEAKKDPEQFKDLLARNKLKNGGFGLPVEFRQSAEIFEEGLKALPAYCEFARKTGADRCATWLMPFSDTLDYKANLEFHSTRLKKIAKILEDYGIRFGLEFVGPPSMRKGKKFEFVRNLETLNELIGAIGTSNMGCLMDVYHWDLAGQTYEDFKKIPGKEWVVMVHINDGQPGLSREEQLDGVRELPGASGFVKIADFMKGLRDLSYDGPVYVEPFYPPFKSMPIEDAVKLAKAAMDKVWL